MSTVCLCLNQTFTFSVSSKIKIFEKSCILIPGPKSLGGIFVPKFYFAERQFGRVFI